MGTPARMGPGFFPFYLGMILLVLGVVIAVAGIRGKRGEETDVEKFHWGPILYVLGSVVVFGMLLKPIGMLLAGVILVVGASLGSHEFKLKPTLILAVVLSIFCAFVFVGGLKLPIPLCPDIESLQSAIKLVPRLRRPPWNCSTTLCWASASPCTGTTSFIASSAASSAR